MTRILITGGSGFLGQILARRLADTHEVYAGYWNSPEWSSGEGGTAGTNLRFDIRDKAQIQGAFEASRPECVVHTAAITKPDVCELNPEQTRAVNVEGSRHIARHCRESGAKLIHISTDLVFDGTAGRYREEDPVNGISEYSRSKIEAEHVVRAEDPTAVVLRVSVMYGRGNRTHPGFIDEIMERWRKGAAMTFFTDQFRSPTFAPQVAQAVEAILETPDVSGLFHLGGADRLSRYDFAILVARAVGAPLDLVRSGSMYDGPQRAPRGADCSLISEKITQALGLKPMPCSEGLALLTEMGDLKRLSG